MTRGPISAEEAAWFLRARKDGDVENLIEALRVPYMRAPAIRRLGELGATDAVPKIIPLLDAKSDTVRTAAAHALGLLQAESARGKLVAVAANDSAPATRAWALYALGCIGLTNLDPRVLRLTSAPDGMVRTAAVAALATSPNADVATRGQELRASEPRRRRREIDRVIKKIREVRTRPASPALG